MATDYAGLKAEIQRWVDNDNVNFVAAIPTFIEDAESWLRRHLHTRDMECRASTPLSPAGATEDTIGVYDLPADWGGHRTVERVGDNLIILYWRKIPTLSDSDTTNWLLTKAPDLYRYAALAAAEGFLKNDPRVPAWSQAADRARQELEDHDEHDRYSGGPLRQRHAGQRPWKLKTHSDDGRYTYLPPLDFFDLVDHGKQTYDRYFTVAEGFIRIWPKPPLPSS